ncbi:isopentenyl-diphosphate delta-isomerase [Candidatus Peregrinibacteria bacterium CG10_big_fil_rev_8_21_14_0_10_49_16]|nr:MAG: isopentenyl-diphosphate delta-isomerase [Candidatus Peregrinibacteria bacterium CG22_combo_CG10-13_8_21_14_all_49_11]PIR51959.1 MAG: isopentenyl-diphosphate delta-isomerase [Candidatus Peregrinibacteria bacterium CG10_big_fil_rev_8_21_14_0_10_49_16]
MTRDVILVDVQGNAIGTMEIFSAHAKPGHLHRAFSVCVFRESNREELLIQKRARFKPLFPHLWSNTCCSHPFPEENIVTAAEKRLQEELGFTCLLKNVGAFVYQADDPATDLSEHEHDTVLIGTMPNAEIIPNPHEVADWKWITIRTLQQDMTAYPEKYSPWFAQVLTIALQCAHV